MFVSVILDPGGVDSAKALTAVLLQYGFTKVQRACFENPNLTEKRLATLKKDIDRVTDYYDVVRLYQYPVQELFAISELSKKQWKRCLLRPTQPAPQQPARPAGTPS